MASSPKRRSRLSSSTWRTTTLPLLSILYFATRVSALPSSFNSSSSIISTTTSNLITPPQSLFRSQVSHPPFPTRISDLFNDFNNLQPQEQRSALEHLKTFSHQFFVLNLDSGFFIQMAVAASVLAVLILIGASVILSRLWRRTFWVFKLTRRQEGLYLIPNALNVFLLFEGAFALLWISFVIYIWKMYDLQVNHLQANIEGFDMYAWLPLILGAFFAGWGSFYTAPGALDKSPFGEKKEKEEEGLSEKRGWRPKWFRFKYFSKPILINTFCIGSGFIIAGALIAPTVLAQRSRNRAFSDYLQLASQIDSQLATPSGQALSSTELPSIMEQASLVWNGADENQWYLNIGYILWTIFASAFLLFYIPSGGYLVWLVWTQVRAQKEVLDGIERRAREAQGARVRPASGLSFRGSQPPGDSLLFQPLSFPSDEDQDNSITVVPSGVAQPVSPGFQSSQSHTSPRTPATIVKELKGEVKEIFFPPLRPEARKRVNRKPSSHSSPTSRYRYIRRCFVNLTILYIGITLGATVFLVIAARLAAKLYQSVLTGPQGLTDIVYQSHIPTAWGAVVFGSATIGSIFVRHFDPASGNDCMKSPVVKKKRVGKSLGMGLSSKERELSPHERTRTLPPVPESVTGTMGDRTVTEVAVFPTDGTNSRGGGQDSSSGDIGNQSFPSLKGRSFGERRAMKFSLGRDSRKPGALILRAMDPSSQTTSQASMGGFGGDSFAAAQQRTIDSGNDVERLDTHAADLEAEQTSSRRSNRSLKSRFPFINRSKPNEEFPQDVTQFSDFDQTTSLRSVDGRSSSVGNNGPSGEMVYYATPYGSIAAPAPREKPLAPARTPPQSPGAEVLAGVDSRRSSDQSPSDSSRSRSGSGSGSRSGSHSFEIPSSLRRQRQRVPLYSQPAHDSSSSSAQTLESGIDPHLVKAQVQALPDRSTIPPSPRAPRFQVKELDATTPPTSEADHGGGLGMTPAWDSPVQPSRSSVNLSRTSSSPLYGSPRSPNSPHSPRRPSGHTSPWIAREWEASTANDSSRPSMDSGYSKWGTPTSSTFPARNFSLNLSRAPGSSGPSQSVLELALRSPSTNSFSQDVTPMASPVRRGSVPTLGSKSNSPGTIGSRNLQAREAKRASNQVDGSPAQTPTPTASHFKNKMTFPTSNSFSSASERQVDAVLPDSPQVRHARFSTISSSEGDQISAPSSPPPSGPLPLPPNQQPTKGTIHLPYVSPVRQPIPLQNLDPPPSARRNRASSSFGRNSSALLDEESGGRLDINDRPRLSPGIFF